MFKKIKKLSTVVLSLGLVGAFFLPNDSVSAKSWDWEITIDANKHTMDNVALPTKGCDWDMEGYYFELDDEFRLAPYGTVYGGQIVELASPY